VARTIKVYLEEGEKSAFAVALDWPGWARRAKTPDLALEALDAHRERYAAIPSISFPAGSLDVVGTLPGNATTDFGAPDARGPWDEIAFSRVELERALTLLRDCWGYFDAVAHSAPNLLRKGPRGGGRDRDAVIDHVREAERAYCSRAGVRVAPRTPWTEQRTAVQATLGASENTSKWPPRYSVRRIAWHVVDHAWEIQDRSEPA
jgi:hypothetical protein